MLNNVGQTELQVARIRKDGTKAIMTHDVQMLCVKGRAAVAAAEAQAALAWLEGAVVPCEGCKNRSRCNEFRVKVCIQVISHRDIKGPLATWNPEWSFLFCNPCVLAGRIALKRARRQLWEELPSFFDLAGWEVLRTRQDVAVGKCKNWNGGVGYNTVEAIEVDMSLA